MTAFVAGAMTEISSFVDEGVHAAKLEVEAMINILAVSSASAGLVGLDSSAVTANLPGGAQHIAALGFHKLVIGQLCKFNIAARFESERSSFYSAAF